MEVGAVGGCAGNRSKSLMVAVRWQETVVTRKMVVRCGTKYVRYW